ncbi:coiled-coil domain-containing protein 97 [Prorops nasuta]|uniref:coiled-coil domain-containing protein 97 n=1 Tax=Prorops nasuta TaxID=863751 RepID=UPI0034CD6EE5
MSNVGNVPPHFCFNKSTRQIDIKNKRYAALKLLIEKREYFSETEMRKRNPLLYDHLIGQYLTIEEKQAIENIDISKSSFLDILMTSIENDEIRKYQEIQKENENNILEEEEEEDSNCDSPNNKSMPEPESETFVRHSKLLWGEDLGNRDESSNQVIRPHTVRHIISNSEKELLRKEFVTHMYQSFLNGSDIDFDYSTVDDNEAYDNIDLRTQDEEDKYFDSESPETVLLENNVDHNESEDELDIYMRALEE